MTVPDDDTAGRFATRLELKAGRVLRCFVHRPASLPAMFGEAVAGNPHGEALVDDHCRLRWRELDAAVQRFAATLIAIGVSPGDRIASLVANRAEYVIVAWAAWHCGAVFVPIDVREPAEAVKERLRHCGATVLIRDDDLADRVPRPAQAPALRRVLPTSAALHPDADATGQGSVPIAAVRGDDGAALLYTSGTSGRPKAVLLSHDNIVHSAMHFEWGFGLRRSERALVVAPLTHVTGLVSHVAAMARCGGALVVQREFVVDRFLQTMAREAITYAALVPAMYRLVLLRGDLAAHDLSHWRLGAFGGAPMPADTIEALARQLPTLSLVNGYGATETAAPAVLTRPGEVLRQPGSVGRAAACAEVAIMSEQGLECPPGERGEVWIRGPMVAAGYWNDAQATAAAFSDGYWHSGDLGFKDAQQRVHIVDRLHDVINRGGYKIASVEVEAVINSYPGVLESALVAQSCPVLGQRAHAYVAWQARQPDGAGLRAHCLERLADYKLPDSFTHQTEPLPRNANGKLQKGLLRAALGGTEQGIRR